MRRTTFRAFVAAALAVTVAGVGAATASPAAAQEAAEAHFVVLGPKHGSLQKTEASVRAAGGEVVKSWPQIGVVIATSTSADFAATVRGKPGVSGAGASRNLAELGAGVASRSASAAGAQRQEMLATVDAVVAHKVSAAPAEPLEANQWGLRAVKSDQANAINPGSR